MTFKSCTKMSRLVLLSCITAATTLQAQAAPVLNRLFETDPMVFSVRADASPTGMPSLAAVAEPSSPSGNLAPNHTIAPAGASSNSVGPSAPSSLAQRMRDQASGVVNTALNFLGMPYRHGGTSESTGFDCSGFTRYMFEMSVGLVLPRVADQQAKAPGLAAVRRDELQPGDLVFFNTLRRTFSHVGIYIGEGKFIHAPKPGADVRVEDMGVAYWAQRFTGARRADPDVDPMIGQSTSESGAAQALTVSAASPAAVMRSATAARHKPPRRVVRRHHR